MSPAPNPFDATTPPAPSDSATPPPALPIAGPIARLAALAYDSFLIFGLLVVPLFVLTAIRQRAALHGAPLQTDGVVHELPPIAPKPVLLLYMILMVAAFYYYFWRRNGQTLGMQAWRLRLENRDGERATPWQCLKRMPVGLLALLCGGLGYWWIWFDREQRAWQDRFSDTRVVVLPKRVKPGKAGRKNGAEAEPAATTAPATPKAATERNRRRRRRRG